MANIKKKDDICKKIEEWRNDPEFLREAREFIRATTS